MHKKKKKERKEKTPESQHSSTFASLVWHFYHLAIFKKKEKNVEKQISNAIIR